MWGQLCLAALSCRGPGRRAGGVRRAVSLTAAEGLPEREIADHPLALTYLYAASPILLYAIVFCICALRVGETEGTDELQCIPVGQVCLRSPRYHAP
jgi:hypothetical protein